MSQRLTCRKRQVVAPRIACPRARLSGPVSSPAVVPTCHLTAHGALHPYLNVRYARRGAGIPDIQPTFGMRL